jgi:hypothetical protein
VNLSPRCARVYLVKLSPRCARVYLVKLSPRCARVYKFARMRRPLASFNYSLEYVIPLFTCQNPHLADMCLFFTCVGSVIQTSKRIETDQITRIHEQTAVDVLTG